VTPAVSTATITGPDDRVNKSGTGNGSAAAPPSVTPAVTAARITGQEGRVNKSGTGTGNSSAAAQPSTTPAVTAATITGSDGRVNKSGTCTDNGSAAALPSMTPAVTTGTGTATLTDAGKDRLLSEGSVLLTGAEPSFKSPGKGKYKIERLGTAERLGKVPVSVVPSKELQNKMGHIDKRSKISSSGNVLPAESSLPAGQRKQLPDKEPGITRGQSDISVKKSSLKKTATDVKNKSAVYKEAQSKRTNHATATPTKKACQKPAKNVSTGSDSYVRVSATKKSATIEKNFSGRKSMKSGNFDLSSAASSKSTRHGRSVPVSFRTGTTGKSEASSGAVKLKRSLRK
jgi:hypothetical protein